MKKFAILLFVFISTSLFGFDPITKYVANAPHVTKSTNGTTTSSTNKSKAEALSLLGKGKIDLIYLNNKFYLYPKLQFIKVDFLRPHDNLHLYLMSLQISTGLFQGLGGDGETVLLPYQIISPHCGVINIEASIRSTFYNKHKAGGYMGMQCIGALKFNSYSTHNTNSNEIEKKIFPSFYAEASVFGQTDLGMGDMVDSSNHKHKKYDLVGFFSFGGFMATAARQHIIDVFGLTDFDTCYGIFGEIGIIIGDAHEFRLKITKLLGDKNFVREVHGYENLIYRLSFNMKI